MSHKGPFCSRNDLMTNKKYEFKFKNKRNLNLLYIKFIIIREMNNDYTHFD